MNWEIFYKTGALVTGVVVGYLFGGWSLLLQALVTLVIIDYVTGLLASGVEGKLSSKVGFKGIAKKVMLFLVVAAGHVIDRLTGQGHVLGDSAIFLYIGNELLSIFENVGRSGVPIPDKFKNAVEILKGKGEGK